MACVIRKFLSPLLVTLAVLLGSVSASSQEVEGLHGNAAAAIEAQIRSADLRFAQVSIFYGDFTGQGTSDALAFVYHDVGGSAPQLVTWIWLDQGGSYSLARTVSIDEVFGLDPRNVSFSPGRAVVTTTVPQPNDPHCCPTGERTFTITLDADRVPPTMRPETVLIPGGWSATASSSPARVNVSGTAIDGKATFAGGCNALLGGSFLGSLYGYEGDALQKIDDQSEPVTFAVMGQGGTQEFSARMHYFAPDQAWVLAEALAPDFLDAFARGEMLTIRNESGEQAVAFELSGSSVAVRTMRQVCGM